MKQRLTFSSLIVLIFASCQLPNETVVGSNQDTEIKNTAFQVDTTYVQTSPAGMVARGKVKNQGTTTISSPWYVEAQFYTDSTYQTKLGGNDTQIGVPLSPGQQTFWTISFSSSNVDVRLYPKFRVREIRAIYKN